MEDKDAASCLKCESQGGFCRSSGRIMSDRDAKCLDDGCDDDDKWICRRVACKACGGLGYLGCVTCGAPVPNQDEADIHYPDKWLCVGCVEVLEVRPLDIRALLDEVEGAIPAEAYADGHETVIDVPAVRWDDPTERAAVVEYQVSKDPTNDERLTQEMEAIK